MQDIILALDKILLRVFRRISYGALWKSDYNPLNLTKIIIKKRFREGGGRGQLTDRPFPTCKKKVRKSTIEIDHFWNSTTASVFAVHFVAESVTLDTSCPSIPTWLSDMHDMLRVDADARTRCIDTNIKFIRDASSMSCCYDKGK
jgi:hypothetical protein